MNLLVLIGLLDIVHDLEAETARARMTSNPDLRLIVARSSSLSLSWPKLFATCA